MAAVELLDEMGITSPLQASESTSNGNSVAAFDHAADPEDAGFALDSITLFLRSTKAPPRDAVASATASAQNGSHLFAVIGCSTCHAIDRHFGEASQARQKFMHLSARQQSDLINCLNSL